MVLPDKPINIFWTGGWDSTFRILQLILVKKLLVQPYYIIDPERKSLQNELKTIQKISSEVRKSFPEKSKLLLPVKYLALSDIKSNKIISKSYTEIRKKQRLGIQYEWLASFCSQYQIFDMEVSLELRVKHKDNVVINATGNYLIERELKQGKVFVISDDAKGKYIYNLFGNMIFPVINNTKMQMYQYSKKQGFSEFLELTWFCHTPVRNKHACGKCQPCQSTQSEGLNWRLPIIAKFRYHTWRILRKITKTVGLDRN
jgi:7-cyano-7-deazaguanine synthase in queuosine biosynthesis